MVSPWILIGTEVSKFPRCERMTRYLVCCRESGELLAVRGLFSSYPLRDRMYETCWEVTDQPIQQHQQSPEPPDRAVRKPGPRRGKMVTAKVCQRRLSGQLCRECHFAFPSAIPGCLDE